MDKGKEMSELCLSIVLMRNSIESGARLLSVISGDPDLSFNEDLVISYKEASHMLDPDGRRNNKA